MSETGTSKARDMTGVRRHSGVGHSSSWDCGACGDRLFSMLGRRMRYLKGMTRKAYVCPKCDKGMSK